MTETLLHEVSIYIYGGVTGGIKLQMRFEFKQCYSFRLLVIIHNTVFSQHEMKQAMYMKPD